MEKERKGISQITGKTEIKLGEKVFYKVSRIHRKEDHDKVKNALWKIYVKENGSWRELKSDPSVPQKKGDEVSYTITNQALAGKELLVEAYIYEPEKMAPPGLKIKVVAGTEKKIQRVELFMVDDTPIKEDTILKYNQTIKVKVYTLNMPNELLKLTLYEDDADKGGHNPKNEKNKVAFTDKQTNNNGFLWHEFKLNAEFSKIANAMMDGSSDKLHEYYVLVESVKYGNKTSENVEVENPEYVVHQTYENGKVIDHKNDKIYEGGVIEEVIIKGKYKKQMGIDPMPKTGRSVSIVSEPPEKKEEKVCDCKKYDLVWGDKVSCEFRKKVVEICKDLWGEDRKKEMANGLMAVMHVETSGTFKAHQIMGKYLQSVGSITKDDFWLEKKDKKTGKITKTSRAVGLIQFTQDALQQIGEFKSGSGFDKLHEVKLRFAKMGEIKQLDFVKKYFEPSKNKIKTPEDIYLHVFAPKGVGKEDEYVLYDKNIDGEKYTQNKSIDNENNADGKIQRIEILGRYRISFAQGLGNRAKSYVCNVLRENQQSTNKNIEWHDPVDDPMLCLYTQNGNYRPRYNVFGTVRKEREHHNHQGIDFLALPGSNAYACVDAYIEYIQIQSGYGNVICLKVKDTIAFLKRKRDFELVYKSEGEILHGKGFNFDGDIYLFYAHLQKVLISNKDKEVKCGQVIAYNGTSGYGSSKDPHLHFEIRSSISGGGLTNRCHPGIFVYYKDENSMTKEEKDYHKKIAQKFWD